MLRLGFIVAPGFQVMGFGALSVFELANLSAGGPFYKVHLLSEEGSPVRSSLGISVHTDPFDGSHFDTVIVSGSTGLLPITPGLIAFVQRAALRSRRIASVCTGAFVLAEAGLLDGRRATTHWAHGRDLQKRYPAIKVEEDRIFVTDGPVWTSAGMSAGIDLALSIVEQGLGLEITRLVSKALVIHHRRAGGQSQHSALLELDAKSDRIQSALAYARRNLHSPLPVERLADAAHLSPRQFSRAFHAETGQSPAKAVENLRLEAARVMMEQGRLPIEFVANETGFADRERMRRAFLRAYGQPPQAMRRNAQI